jgi:glycosyltransferase involved in cell wall biosynthesis
MSRRPRLLYVSSSFPCGMGDVFFEPEAFALRAAGVDVIAVPVRPRGEVTAPDALAWTIRRPLLDLRMLASAALEAARRPGAALAALRLVLSEPSPNVLLRNLVALPKAFWVARLARSLGADHIHAHWAGPPSTVAMVAGRLSGVPWSFTAHFADIAAGNLLREKSRSATFVRFISLAMMELARKTAPGVDESRWVLLELGIDVPSAWRLPGELNSPPVVLMAARFDPEKRHDLLVEVADRLRRSGRHVEFWLAGGGRLAADVRRDVERRGLGDSVRLLGWVSNPTLLAWYEEHRVDLVVLTSDGEGVPVALMEPLARGIPVVACDVGGVRELVGDGCGELVPAGDAVAFAAAMEGLLDSGERRRLVAERGRSRVESTFSAQRSAARQLELFGFATARSEPGSASSAEVGAEVSGSGPAAAAALLHGDLGRGSRDEAAVEGERDRAGRAPDETVERERQPGREG